MSGKLGESSRRRASQEEVRVHDFAQSPDGTPLNKLPTRNVRAPQTKEDWDTFITRYSLGEFSHCCFDADASPSPPRSPKIPSPSAGAAPVPPGLSHFSSRSSQLTVTQVVSPSTITPEPSPTLVASRKNSYPFGQLSDSDQSSDNPLSGTSNQDPSIPNIDDGQSGESSTALRSVAVEAKGADGGKVNKGPDAMTRENMDRLGEEQSKKRAKERDADAAIKEDGRRSSKGKTRQRRRDHAELASVGKAVSVDSSQEDEPGSSAPWPGSTKRRVPRRPRSRGSWSRRSRSPNGSLLRGGGGASLDAALLDSGTNDSTSASAVELNYDHGAERARVREFFEQNGYMPAPRQSPDAARRRLRVIRRLGLEQVDPMHRATLDRFTRLATTVFKTNRAIISIIGKDRQTFLSEIGMGKKSTSLDVSFCSHAVMSPETNHSCMVVPDLSQDWRFRNNPYVKQGSGPTQFYAGAPLKVGSGSRSTVIGTLCVTDHKPRNFTEDDRALLSDLADCVVSELELIYSQQASVESTKLHQISVDFLRRSLKHRPNERAGSMTTGTNDTSTGTGTSSASSANGKRISGADKDQDEASVDIYDEACREIRYALDAYAVSVVDLSQFHLFYPTYQNSSTGGSSTRGGSVTSRGKSQQTGTASQSSVRTGQTGSAASSTVQGHQSDDDNEAYSKPANIKRARPTYAVTDAMAPGRTPQVLYIPSRRKSGGGNSKWNLPSEPNKQASDNLAVLGYSCSEDNFAFNFTSTPAARKIISDFIASNVKTRRVWYTRDDSEGIAQSITHLMPPGTETSMAMPVFGFDGQVAFAVVACWTDPLYTYPAGALQFVETIAGSLLASVMKERLHQAERAQLNFAAAASHELRTPLHQINAAASLLRTTLRGVLEGSQEGTLSARTSIEDRMEALGQLEIIEANGLSLGNILENIIDTLDIGRMASKVQVSSATPDGTPLPSDLLRPRSDANITDFTEVLETVVEDAMNMEAKARRIAGGKGLEGIEVIVEVLPRVRGGWRTTNDSGPLARSLSKVIHNAVKFTEKGHVHITVQDVSRDVVLPAGYDNSIKLSTISIDIKDTGKGMSTEFLDREVLRPFAKEDPFASGSGLGLGLAQRMVELLGGKLAIASTPGKGTLVHIEVPIHLLNEDNDSDQDVMASGDAASEFTVVEPNRQDGIYLIGWIESKDPTIRRVGKSLIRQLKLHFCRVVTEIHYASLIVIPEGAVKEAELAKLCRLARPGVEVIVLGKDHSVGALSSTFGPSTAGEHDYLAILGREHARQRAHGHNNSHQNGHHSRDHPHGRSSPTSDPIVEYLKTIPIVYLTRPLRPSVVKRIMRPAEQVPRVPEKYKSEVVGGAEAREEAQALGQGHLSDTLASTQKPEPTIPGNDIPAGDSDQDVTSSDAEEQLSTVPPWRGSVPPQYHHQHQQVSPRSSTHTLRLPKIEPQTEEEITSAESTSETPATESSMTSDMTSHDSVSLSLRTSASGSVDSDSASSDSWSRPQPLREIRSGSEHTIRAAQTADGKPLKVLVVEDNAVNRKILTTMLKRTSCEFVEAADGVEAVTQFNSFHPDLVLLDITMPRKDGFAAAAEMRRIEATLPVDSDIPLEEVMKTLELGDTQNILGQGQDDSHISTLVEASASQSSLISTSSSTSSFDPTGQRSPSQSSSRPLSPTSPASSHSGLGTGAGSWNKRARIIAVTAMSAEHQRRKGLIESGIDMWMVKPIAMRELRGIVETMKEEKERERDRATDRGGWSGSEVSGGGDKESRAATISETGSNRA